VQAFLKDKDELKRLMQITKETDSFYLSRRSITDEYDPRGAYDFPSWKHHLTDTIRVNYESLHRKGLLYTTEEQRFGDAIKVLEEINAILRDIGE
jgi:hypothetical protein